jgi:hypothetical protein
VKRIFCHIVSEKLKSGKLSVFAAKALKVHQMGRILTVEDNGSAIQSELNLIETGKYFFPISRIM